MSGRTRDSTVRNVWTGAVLCFLLAASATTVLPWALQQSLGDLHAMSPDSYRMVVSGLQILQTALFPLAAVLAGVGIILGWMRKHLRKAPQA